MSYAAPAAGVLCMELANPSADTVGVSTAVCPYRLAESVCLSVITNQRIVLYGA